MPVLKTDSGQLTAAGSSSWLRLLYVFLTYLAVPFLLLHLLWRGVRVPGYRRRIRERFGFGMPRLARSSIWVHAVSVGEVQAAAPLVRTLLKRHPGVPLVLTTMTPTGSERVRALFGDRVIHSYVPYDLAGSVQRFFDWAQPSLAIIMETELWPNLYHECGQRQVPLVLASARVSLRSVRYYRQLIPLFRNTLANGIVIAAQTPVDAERFSSLGANPALTHVTGNIKFDFELPAGIAARGRELREEQARDRPVWIAASTHDGEEIAVLEAHARVLERHPGALLVLVPRHPERFAAVAALLDSRGISHVTRSSRALAGPATSVLLGDSMGELTTFYAAADVAFVGGSLVRIGGHNLLEPVALGVPVVTGPHNENAADIAALLFDCGAALMVPDWAGLAAEVSWLLGDQPECRKRGAAGIRAIEANRGALARLLALVDPLID
ncbi:MAG: lipid IV(A) 3-deoxy-D-manno-octulosonic acid transferase [Gammaproteobacteria bacterium]|nr:lipid IV(A) 3-deoxy-D-manno-octulosonic acid transferase [Gammaproteobacteria bacterium]